MTVRTMAPDLSDFPDAVNDADWPGLGPYVTPQAYEIPGDFGGLVRTDFSFGSSAYTGIAGKPFLWNAGAEPTASSFKLTISDIVVTGPNGQHPSFGLVAADAEDTQHGEYNSFRSDQPLSLLDEVNPHPDSALTTPNSGVHGSFAQKVQYNGDRTIANVEGLTQESETAPDLPSSNLLFAASSPTYIQQSYNGTSRNGSVYGFMLARNQVTTTILGGDGKLAATATGVDHASGVSATAAVASATDPAATVSATVRSTTSDATIVGQWGQVVDSTEASNDVLHGYSRTWKCEVNGETREDIFPNAIEADSFTMDATKLTPYDFVHCTVTYGAYPGLISWLKADATTQTKIEGSSWQLVNTRIGATYHLSDNGGVTPPAWDADGARGQILAAVPEWGTYEIVETAAPAGYVLNAEKLYGEVNSSQVFIGEAIARTEDGSHTILNERGDGALTWEKTDAVEGTRLGGSAWTLTAPGGATTLIVDNAADDLDPADGAFRVNVADRWGDYTLQEATAPAGYQLPDPNPTFSATVSGSTLEPSFGVLTNARIPASLSWRKIDATSGGLLGGTTWSLAGPEGTTTVVDNGEGDTDPAHGAITVSGLAWGDYALTETAAPAGYELSDRTYQARVDRGNPTVTLDPIANQRRAGSLAWSKVEAGTRAALAGSTWSLSGPHGYSVTVTGNQGIDANDADGGFALTGVPWGTYTLTERTAPEGFALDTTERTVVVDGTNLTADFGAIENARIPDHHDGTLPFTGPGALWTYATIGVLSVGAGVLLMVTRRRTGA